MKKIEITYGDGSTSVEQYDESRLTAEECFRVLSILNNYADDGDKTVSYREF